MDRVEQLVTLHRDGHLASSRNVALEAPIAIEINGFGYAVMMATPADLIVFATGFALTERLADTVDDIVEVDVHQAETGWIVRVTLDRRVADRVADRIRYRASDSGCGLCGIASLDQLFQPVARAPRPATTAAALFAALDELRLHQPANARTGAHHAAAWCSDDGMIVAAFEDVGRHNALDKLIGARAQRAIDTPIGFILVTSRISFEMVDKALVARAPLLIGISAPTSMAIDHARTNGLTLVALARSDAMLVLNDPWGAVAGAAALGSPRVVAEEGLEPPTPGL